MGAELKIRNSTAEIAKAFAESEFEKYRVTQDKIYKSSIKTKKVSLLYKKLYPIYK